MIFHYAPSLWFSNKPLGQSSLCILVSGQHDKVCFIFVLLTLREIKREAGEGITVYCCDNSNEPQQTTLSLRLIPQPVLCYS